MITRSESVIMVFGLWLPIAIAKLLNNYRNDSTFSSLNRPAPKQTSCLPVKGADTIEYLLVLWVVSNDKMSLNRAQLLLLRESDQNTFFNEFSSST